METLSTVFDKVKAEDHKSVRLYFITRDVKPGIAKTKKMLDKYQFSSLSIDIDEDLQKHLHKTLLEQIYHKQDINKYELVEYEVIDDDTDKILTYTLTSNKVLPFASSIKDQLKEGVDIKPVMKLNDIRDKIWAYCIGILHEDKVPTYSLRKFYSSKIAIDESVDSLKKGLNSILTLFNTTNSKLELFTGETISFDKNIDCLYINDKFYIFSKKNFERIVGLEEEFKESAYKLVNELKTINLIEGLEVLSAEIELNPTLLKKLAKLAQKGDYKNLTTERIKKMQEVAAQYGLTLNVEGNKLKINDNKDIDLIIKMLDDYFLESQQTGLKYGSHAKKQLQVVTGATR